MFKIYSALAITVMLSIETCSYAQEDNSPKASSPVVSKAEKIVVTGSRIKRIDTEGVNPVLIIDQRAITSSGANNAAELIETLTISSAGAYSSPTVNDNRGTVTNANLRGLGPDRTLILLDGQRLPDEGGLSIVDLSTIPIAFIEKIEILRDSASAIYGSDAVGGVVNIITKKDFQGNAIAAKGVKPINKGGEQTFLSLTSGTIGEHFKILNVLSYHHKEPVFFRNREWTKKVLSGYSIPGNIGLSTIVKNKESGNVELDEQGNPKIETKLYAPSNCQEKATNGLCVYNISDISMFSPEQTQLGLLSKVNWEINDSFSAFGLIRVQQNENKWNMAPNAASFAISAETLAANPNLNVSGEELAPGKNATVQYRANAWGPKAWLETNNLIGTQFGLQGTTQNEWEWRLAVSNTETNKKSVNPTGYFLKDIVESKINDGSLNPFETDFSNSNLNQTVEESKYKPFVENTAKIQSFDGQINGELLQMLGGKASLALGMSRLEQSYGKEIDTQSQTGNVSNVSADKSGKGSRSINAVYGEMALPFTQNFEAQVNVRHDNYNDFGSTTNPQLGIKYRILPNVLARATMGRGFKAPSLDQVYNQGSATVLNLIDSPRGENSLATEIEVETYGSRNLKEEKSINKSVGVIVEPLLNATFQADYWYVKVDNIIRTVDAQKALDAIAQGDSIAGVEVYRLNDDPNAQLVKMRLPTSNLGTSEDAGYSLDGSYKIFGLYGIVDVSSQYSKALYSKSVAFPGASQVDVIGDRGHPWWRMLNRASWIHNESSLTLQNNIISKQKKRSSSRGQIGSYTTYDVNYSWEKNEIGGLSISILNIRNTPFPKDDSERVGDDQRIKELFSPNGRTFVIGANKTI
jgi:iron complex outermembrane receptor protein